MNPTLDTTASPLPDQELVTRTLAGDRDAFARIVARYQTLICSVAYNATGSLAQSEDLAQETFIAGWQRLPQLHDPAKLRAWLCGIAHNLIKNRRRRLATEPSHLGTELADDAASTDAVPSEVAIKREQEAILWQALERIPDDYRQPLILFYREHRSVERVARDLDLSEDAVRQRLSRGRRLLQQQVLAFVEGALAQTAPGPMFTVGVLGALPLLAGSSLATATAGGTAVPWGAAGLGAKLLTVFNVAIGPLLALLAAWLGVRASLADAPTAPERRLVKRYFLMIAASTVVFTLVSIPLNALAKAHGGLDPRVMTAWLALLLTHVGVTVVLALRLQRAQQRLRHEERALRPAAGADVPGANRGRSTEFRSRWTLLGLPLLHVRLQSRGEETTPPALGWIAIGNYAFGVLFAWGGVAVGAVSGGGISAGLVSVGAVSLGLLAFGGLAIGAFAMGGVAVGVMAAGAFSFGWAAAQGRYAVAHEFALGLHAVARHANDAAAETYFSARPWLDLRTVTGKALFSFVWLPALPIVWQSLRRRRRGFTVV